MPSQTVDLWYQVDTTKGIYNAMKSDAASQHSQHAPGAELSINKKNDGTEALIKVRTDGNYNPGWESAPFVIRKFTNTDHEDAVALVNTPEWARPEWPTETGPYEWNFDTQMWDAQ